MLVGPWLEFHLISPITTSRDVFLQSSFQMSVIRSLHVRTRSRHLPAHEGWGGASAPAENGERGIGRDFGFGIKSYHFAPGGTELMDRPKPVSPWQLRGGPIRIRGVERAAGRARVECNRVQNSATIERPWKSSKTQVAIGVTEEVTVGECLCAPQPEFRRRGSAVFITAGAGRSSGWRLTYSGARSVP